MKHHGWRNPMSHDAPTLTTTFNKVRVCLFALLLIVMLTACGSSGPSEAPTPTPLPTPVVPEKPTYIVARGTVTRSLEFTGRVSPVEQQELFFRTDGFVRSVYVARDDRVRAGDRLADLEIGELENQLAQARLDLAQVENQSADALAEAKNALEKARPQLQKALAEDTQAGVTAEET